MTTDSDITWNWPDNAYGTIQQAAILDSQTLSAPYGYGIYLPPSYKEEPARRYPVLYWLHGYSSRPHYGGYFTERLDAAIRLGQAPEMIVIAVNGLYSAMFCDDASGKRPVETVIMQELIPHVDATYRTIASHQSRALEGFSRGGFGAAHLAFKHPQMFGALSMLAGAFHDRDQLPRLRHSLFLDYWNGDHALWQRENAWDLATLAVQNDLPPLPMRMVVGDRDDGQYEGNLSYHQHLTELGIPCELTIIPQVTHTVRGLYDHYQGNPFTFFKTALPD